MAQRLLTALLAALLAASAPPSAPAWALDIELVSGDWQPINIVIEPFVGEENTEGDVPSQIIGNDLTSSGNFDVRMKVHGLGIDVSPERMEEIRDSGGEYLLVGNLTPTVGKQYRLTFALYDSLTENELGTFGLDFTDANKRAAAHNVSNWVYEQIINKPGIFHTKIAYVLRRKNGSNELKIADYDGYNRLTILTSDDNIISPTWSADGNSLLYVSFERNKPIIYRQSLLTGGRDVVANFKGSNSAPASAPDNRTIAAALTEHGGPQQIYLISDGKKARLRRSRGINTEPTFSPDGRHIVFTSDESTGQPQLYEYPLNGGQARRLTYGSNYNVSPDYSADGRGVAFIRRAGSGDNVAVLDRRSLDITMLTNIRLADSPSFSPNDDIIAFVDETRKKYLATVSINGKVTVLWEVPEEGAIIDPSWSPMKSDWF